MGTMATILLALSCSALLIYPIVRRMRRNGFFLAALPLAFAFGVLLLLGAPGDPVVEQLQWLPQLGLDLTFRMDQLSWLFALLVTGAGKADTVAAMITGPVTTQMPASFLQLHRDVELICDGEAAAKLR